VKLEMSMNRTWPSGQQAARLTTPLDRLIEAAAVSLSRRKFAARVVGIAAAVALWGPGPTAFAVNCNQCFGPCIPSNFCQNSCVSCTSPNGQWVVNNWCCSFCPGCFCANDFQAHVTVCDDGSTSGGCPACIA
jgi:hypothetical protein